MTFPKDEIKAAIIVLGSLLVLSLLIIVIGGSKLFVKYDKYYTKVTNAAGLEVGAQVRVGGVRDGRVLDILAPEKPGELVTIVIGINEGTPIFNGTTARISQIGFVGDIYLLLTVKGTTPGRLPPGSTLPAVEPVEFTEIMESLNSVSGTLEKLIADVDRIFSERNVKNIEILVENTNSAVVNTSASVESVAKSLLETNMKVKEVLGEVELFFSEGRDDFKEVLVKARKDLETAEGMILAVEEAAKRVGDATVTVEDAVGRQDKNIDQVLADLDRTLRDLQDLIQSLKLKPWSLIYREEAPDKKER